MSVCRHLEADVLVVGGGGAGARAALAAQEAGASTLLVTKHFLGRSGCTPSLVYMSAVGPWGAEGDSPALAIEDLLKAGGNLGRADLIKILVDESPARLTDLENYGVRFDKQEKGGGYKLAQLAGHSKPRTFTFNARKLGTAMMSALTREVRRRGIEVIQQAMLTRIFLRDGSVNGAAFLDYRNGEFFVVTTGSIVLATGGYGAIYSPSTVAKEDTGDGHALALDAGAELIDMENVSFLPGNNRAWGSQRSWGETPHFLNTKGERFMLRYNPSGAEFGTKEVLVHAIAQEVLEGRGTDKGGVYSDLTHLPWDNPSVRSDMSDLIEHGLRFGFDPKKKPVEMWPVAHTPTGGIPVNERCETSVPGLYAAGSTAGGIYGFGRIEGFTSIITQVYGKRAGEAAAARSLSAETLPPSDGETENERDRVLAVLDGREGTSPSLLKERIQSIMYQHAWILRDGPGLSEGLAKILRLRDEKISVSSRSRAQNLEWVEALEVPNMLLMAELVIRASSLRTESRGSFARVDYPSADDETWLVNIAFKKSGGALTTRIMPAPVAPRQV